MKKQRLILMVVTVAAVVLLAVVPADGGVLYLLAWPFVAAGQGLRALSLSGGAGNAAAIVLYVLVCLWPLALKWGRKWQKEDWMLALAAGVMFYVMYGLVNPGSLPVMLGSDVGQTQLCFGVYSVIVSWGVLKLLRASERVRQEKIYSALRLFLTICAVEMVAVGLGLGWQNFRDAIEAVREANTWPGVELTPTYVFLFLRYAASGAEYALDAAVMVCGAGLLTELERDAYSDACVAAADRVAVWCKRSLMVTTLTTLTLNLGQLFCAGWLQVTDVTLRLPILSMAIAFGALALTRLLVQGRELKEDNDLFI